MPKRKNPVKSFKALMPTLAKIYDKQIPQIVRHILYGDIYEMPLSILKSECPTDKQYDSRKGDLERETRLSAAATVQAWLKGNLHRNGYIWDPRLHSPRDRILPPK